MCFERLSLPGDQSIGRQISILLGRSCPTAVPGLVTSRPVNAVDGVIGGWFFTHILEEIPEVHPPIADFNVSVFGSLLAPLLHVRPRSIGWCIGLVVLCGFLAISTACARPTHPRPAMPKIGLSDIPGGSTGTATRPELHVVGVLASKFKDGVFTEFHSFLDFHTRNVVRRQGLGKPVRWTPKVEVITLEMLGMRPTEALDYVNQKHKPEEPGFARVSNAFYASRRDYRPGQHTQ